MSLYYLDDYSLGEIADEYEVSRQAVYDNIKRTEAMLEEYEAKLLLFYKSQERSLLLNKLGSLTEQMNENDVKEQLIEIIASLEKLD